MSKPLSMGDLTVKFHSNRAGVYRGETTIGQAPEGSLYRVVRRLDPAEFEIATLVPTGWITLLQRLGGRAQDRSMTASADSGLTLDDVLDLSTALGSRRCEDRAAQPVQARIPAGLRAGWHPVHERRGRAVDLQAHREAESSA